MKELQRLGDPSFCVVAVNNTVSMPQHSAPAVREYKSHLRFIQSGHGWYFNGQERIELLPNHCLILPGHSPGYVRCDPADPYNFHFISYFGSEADNLTQRILEKHGCYFPIAEIKPFIALLQHMRALPMNTKHFSLVDALLSELLCRVLENKEKSGTPNLLEYINNLIDEQLYQSIDRNHIAESLHIHPLTLDRSCKEHYGCTLRQLHEQRRMELASTMLDDHSLSVQDVSQQLGFRDQFHFSRVFKKHYQLSPKRFQLNRLASKQHTKI